MNTPKVKIYKSILNLIILMNAYNNTKNITKTALRTLLYLLNPFVPRNNKLGVYYKNKCN